MLNLEWFTKHNFAESYKKARQGKKMMVFKTTKQIVADFADRKDKVANPTIEVHSDEGLLIVSRIMNFEHELRQVAQDVPVTLILDGTTIGKLSAIRDLWIENVRCTK